VTKIALLFATSNLRIGLLNDVCVSNVCNILIDEIRLGDVDILSKD